MIYWDTSVVLKLYVDEAESSHWQTFALAQQLPLRSSSLLKAELAHALKQNELRGEIVVGAAKPLFELFCHDLEAGRFLLVPIGQDVLEFAARFAIEGGPLRTLDGLHLATAVITHCHKIATTDQRLAEAALHRGLEVLEGL